jgi:phytanoyl-CoA hydroxylase
MLTPQQIEQYKRDGVLVVSNIFSGAELDELESEADGIIARRLAGKAHLDATWGGDKWKEAYGKAKTVIFHTHDVQAYSAAWTRALVQDRFTLACSEVLGSPNVELHHTKLFQKPSEKGSAFPMHQDYLYFPHQNHTMTAAVIMLTDADEEMGCIRVYPGSYKLGPQTPWEHHHLDPAKWPLEKATPVITRRGDVIFFNYLTVHGSDINRSPRTRKSVLVQFRDPTDHPQSDGHRSHAQCMMLRGINPRSNWDHAIAGTLRLPAPTAPPAPAAV